MRDGLTPGVPTINLIDRDDIVLAQIASISSS